LCTKEELFLLSAKRYICFLLLRHDGKLKNDQDHIDQFIRKYKLSIQRTGNYLTLPKGKLSEEHFLELGLLINSSNFTKDSIQLAIPVSCTKLELLDTLERVSTLLTR
jgi:hypothetical protein